MHSFRVDRLTLWFEEEDRPTAEVVREVCSDTARLLRERWRLSDPEDCRVYLMTSWRRFVFQAAPWPWRMLLAITYPLWAPAAQRTWVLAGGWAQLFGKRRAVGIKPPRLMSDAGAGLGSRIFVEEVDPLERVRRTTCHELTHAYMEHLRLPHWLKEGTAMVAVDRLVGNGTVLPESISLVPESEEEAHPELQPSLKNLSAAPLIALYVRGYWVTRYLDEEHPALLRELLSRRYRPAEITGKLAAALNTESERPWSEIHELVAAHYSQGTSMA